MYVTDRYDVFRADNTDKIDKMRCENIFHICSESTFSDLGNMLFPRWGSISEDQSLHGLMSMNKSSHSLTDRLL